MADKGFDISFEVLVHGCVLNIPPFVKGGHLSKSNVIKTRKIASLRIHVERAIGRNKGGAILYVYTLACKRTDQLMGGVRICIRACSAYVHNT